jgi:hypothetical protein
MSEPEGVVLKIRETWHVHKWDASIVGETPPDPTQIDAAAHPGCIEIWEIPPDAPATCIYRRE